MGDWVCTVTEVSSLQTEENAVAFLTHISWLHSSIRETVLNNIWKMNPAVQLYRFKSRGEFLTRHQGISEEGIS